MIKSYSDFAAYQAKENPHYKTPTFEDVVKDQLRFKHYFDSEKNVFYGLFGPFAEKPGSKFEISWQEISNSYDFMYSDFARYGTD